MTPQLWMWIGFGVFALDLGVFHRKTHTVGLKEALALLFNEGATSRRNRRSVLGKIR